MMVILMGVGVGGEGVGFGVGVVIGSPLLSLLIADIVNFEV